METGQYEQSNLMKRLEYYGAGNMEQEIKRIQFLTDQGCQSFFDQITAIYGAQVWNRFGQGYAGDDFRLGTAAG